MRSATAVAAGAVGLVLVTGCGGPPGAPAVPSASFGSVQGRLAFFGALPGDSSGGVLVLDLADGQRVRVGDQQEAWSVAWAGPDRLALVRGPSRTTAQGEVAGELVLAAADGSDEGTRVGDVADVLEVTASADGAHLAFLGRTEASSRACLDPPPAQPLGVYAAAGNGSGVRRVVDVPTSTRSPVLAPDGRTVAVLDAGEDTPVPAGGDWCASGAVRLVLIDTTTGASRVVAGMPEIAGTPRWSPDGSTLVLDGGESGIPARDVVFVDAATATARRVPTPEVAESRPVFSPDGQHLAVLAHTAGTDPASTASIAVGAADYDLAWTPDSSHLVVAGAVLEPACGEADPAGDDSAPQVCDVFTATTDLRIVDATGGELGQVSDTVTGSDAGLTFAP